MWSPRGQRGAVAKCPLPDHDDAYAPCQVFGEAEHRWWRFGCSRGGRIYDLASLISGGAWGRDLRGEAFRSVRENGGGGRPLTQADVVGSLASGSGQAWSRCRLDEARSQGAEGRAAAQGSAGFPQELAPMSSMKERARVKGAVTERG
jgi:hypothetical protein